MADTLNLSTKNDLLEAVDEVYSTLYSSVEFLPYLSSSTSTGYKERVIVNYSPAIVLAAKVTIRVSGQILIVAGTEITADIAVVVSAKEAQRKGILDMNIDSILRSNLRYKGIEYRIDKFIDTPTMIGGMVLAHYIFGTKV